MQVKSLLSKVPGFRSGNKWRSILASLGYGFGLLFLLALLTPGSPSSKIEDSSKDFEIVEERKESDEKTKEEASEEFDFYPVTKVVDGDTIHVLINGKTEKIRLIGIDSPEIQSAANLVEKCWGEKALDRAKQLLIGQQVRLEADTSQGDRDRFGRLLRYVFLPQGTNVNQILIQEGWAKEFTYEDPYNYQIEFKFAQTEAIKSQVGIWGSECDVEDADVLGDEVSSASPTAADTPPTEAQYVPPTISPQNTIATTSPVEVGGAYVCDCSKYCSKMASCEEAMFQLNNCGCSERDGDKDGVPCESLCPGG